MWEAELAGTIGFGGCVIDDRDGWSDNWHCWACVDRSWLARHAASEHRAGRTEHDCADDGLLWNPDSDENGVRLGWRDVTARFRPPGFIDRLWPYLRDVAGPAPAWRPNLARIADALAAEVNDPDPDRITDADIVGLGRLTSEVAERVSDVVPDLERLLLAIPRDLALHELDTVAYEQHVGQCSPAAALVARLKDAAGVPTADAVRLAARKRPALLIERDPLVDAALGIPEDRQVWRPWWRTLTADERLVKRLEQLRNELDVPEVPLLRIAWLSVRTCEQDAAAAGGPSAAVDLPESSWSKCPYDAPPALVEDPVEWPLDSEDDMSYDNEENQSPFIMWLEWRRPLELLPRHFRARARAWSNASDSIPLRGGPDEPFDIGGTPRGVFHAHLRRYVADVSDGLPGWRSPARRVHAHLFGERQSLMHLRNWSRGYDDWFVRSPGAHHFGLLASGVPLDYADDPDEVFFEDAVAVTLRAGVDEDGFRIELTQDEAAEIWHTTDIPSLIKDLPPHALRLEDLDVAGYHDHLSHGSAVWRLVEFQMTHAKFSEATAWMLCARLRPRLVPSPDRIVGSMLGLRPDEDSRPYWWWSLRNDATLRARLEGIQVSLAVEDKSLSAMSTLRLAEIIVLRRESDRRLAVSTEETLFPFDVALAEESD